MIFFDTNVIIDLWGEDSEAAEWSRGIYRREEGVTPFGCNLVVVAELAGQTDYYKELVDRLAAFHIEVLDLTVEAAFAAGRAFAEYRRRGGRRETILPDFLIAGHAAALQATLVTRDRRLASYFPGLTVLTPETDHG